MPTAVCRVLLAVRRIAIDASLRSGYDAPVTD
jgi:hypothetical protein